MSLLLSADELQQLTGYRQPAAQLEELRRQGFHRARRNPAGAVVLERSHFEAVCTSRDSGPVCDQPELRPQKPRQPKLRAAA